MHKKYFTVLVTFSKKLNFQVIHPIFLFDIYRHLDTLRTMFQRNYLITNLITTLNRCHRWTDSLKIICYSIENFWLLKIKGWWVVYLLITMDQVSKSRWVHLRSNTTNCPKNVSQETQFANVHCLFSSWMDRGILFLSDFRWFLFKQ